MNLNALLFLCFNIGLGSFLIRRSLAILRDGRLDLIQREYRVPFVNPELVAKQLGYWNLTTGVSFFLTAIVVLTVIPNIPLRAMLSANLLPIAPLIIWKFVITRKHDAAVGYRPIHELNGVERAHSVLNERLDSGEILVVTVISVVEGGQARTNGTAARMDGGISLQIERTGASDGVSTETHQFVTAAEFSRYLQQHTILRLGDFKSLAKP